MAMMLKQSIKILVFKALFELLKLSFFSKSRVSMNSIANFKSSIGC